MPPELSAFVEHYGPGIAATVVAGMALILARFVLQALWGALVWTANAIIGEIKWRIGWF